MEQLILKRTNPWKLSNLLPTPTGQMIIIQLRYLLVFICTYVLQLINRHHCEWTVLPSYLIDTSLGTSTPSNCFAFRERS